MFWLTIIFVAAHLMPVRIHDKKQKELLVLWWTWSRACRRNTQYWSPPALLRKHVRAPAPLPRHPERHMEQRHGQGHRPGVPLARDAREWHVCNDCGNCCGREDQRILRWPRAAADTAGAEYHRGDLGRAAAGNAAAGPTAAAVSAGMERA